MLKRADTAVYDTIRRGTEGTLEGGPVYYGLPDGVGLSEMKYTRHIVPKAYMDSVEEMEAQIIAGELDVIDTRMITAEQVEILNQDPTCAGLEALKAALAG